VKSSLSQLYISVSVSKISSSLLLRTYLCSGRNIAYYFCFIFPETLLATVLAFTAIWRNAAVHNRTDVFDLSQCCSASSKLINNLQGHIYITPTGGNRPHSRGLVLFIRLAVAKYGTTTGQPTMSLTHCWLAACNQLHDSHQTIIRSSLLMMTNWPSNRSCRCCCWDDVVFQSSLGNTSQWTVFFLLSLFYSVFYKQRIDNVSSRYYAYCNMSLLSCYIMVTCRHHSRDHLMQHRRFHICYQ